MNYTASLPYAGSFPDWGDVPTWVLAGIALLALIASAIAANIFYQQLKLLKSDQVRQVEARRRAQAESVSAWVSGWNSDIGRVEVSVRNGSEEPIWQVTVLVDSQWGRDYMTETTRLNVLPPKDLVRLQVPIALPHSEAESMQKVAPPVRMEFDDAAGRIWRRNERGHLREFVVPEGQDRPPRNLDWGNDWGDEEV